MTTVQQRGGGEPTGFERVDGDAGPCRRGELTRLDAFDFFPLVARGERRGHGDRHFAGGLGHDPI